MAKPTDMPGATAVLDETEDETLAEATEVTEDDGPEMFRTFTDQAVAPIGKATSDGRMFATDIDLTFRSTPLPLQWCKQNSGGHFDSFTVGVIEDIRLDGDLVLTSGYMLNSPEADEACELLAHGVSNPSVDLANADWHYTDKDGNELDWDELWDLMDDGGEYFMTFTKAEVIATTLVSTPAFDTRFALDAERSTREVAIVASAAETFRPKVYKAGFFEDPKLAGPTLPTMGEDGRIYGHLAVFGECHRSIQDHCVMVPRSPTGYSMFHTSPAVRLDNGSRLPVGRLTVGTGHADPRMAGAPAAAHYDNTGATFALVRVGEDAHGVWFSGVAAPWATSEQLEQGLAAPLSGDWRDFGQGLELVAALAVNTPGFSIKPRGTSDAEDRPIALVASGRLSPRAGRGRSSMTKASIKAIMKEAIAEERRESELAARKAAALSRANAVKLEVAPDTGRIASALDRARAAIGGFKKSEPAADPIKAVGPKTKKKKVGP